MIIIYKHNAHTMLGDESKRLKSVDLLLIISIYKNATGMYCMSTQILHRKTVYCEQK